MKKVMFILAMLFSPSVFAATLTTNTVPYVCQGGASPQLCNSNISTDSSGNVHLLGAWQSISPNTVYQAATDGIVQASATVWAGNSALFIVSDSSSSPSTLRAYSAFGNSSNPSGSGPYAFSMIRKGDYYYVSVVGTNAGINFSYFIPLGA